MKNDDKNNIEEKEKSNTNNDSSYIVLENILYCSSPIRGIKSKSNIENNKNFIFTPLASNTDMYDTHFTFNIFKEASTDIGSKEEIINSQKNSNIISDFSLSNLRNSKLDNTRTYNTDKKEQTFLEKENNNIKEEIEKEEEMEEDIKNNKFKSILNKNNNYYNNNNKEDKIYSSSNLDEEDNEDNNEGNKKKYKRNKKRYVSMGLVENNKMKFKKDENIDNVKKYASIDAINEKYKKEKKINERKIIKEIKEKLKNNDIIKNKNNKNKKNNNKLRYAITFRYPLTSNEDNINNENKFKTAKKRKKSNNPFNNDDINFEDKNYISHPIKNSRNVFFNKSSRFIKNKQFSLVKEIDRDYEKQENDIINKREVQSAKKINKLKNSKKKNKKTKQHNTEKPKKYNKLLEEKNNKEVSDFYEYKDNNIKNKSSKKDFKNKSSSLNIFRKANIKNMDKNIENNCNNIFKTKKSSQIILFDKNRRNIDNKFKLKSSITLNKKTRKKRTVESTKEKINKKDLLRRHTIFITTDKNLLYKKNNKNDNLSSFSSDENNDSNDNGYDEDCSSSSNSSIEINNKKTLDTKKSSKKKNTNMKIREIREDKLILNYQDKKETIEVLSDKENIDNYYEYLDLCLDTLQDINIKEVPKSKTKINFKFPKDKKDKKIALFDLDETLVHCIGEINQNNCDKIEYKESHKIKVILPCKKEVTIGINIRPHWKESLDKIKDIYNIVIFTASHQSYSDAVLNYLDPEDKYFHYRLYRDSCAQYKTNDMNFYIKDLDIFKDNYNLKDIIIIDNSILSFAYHLNNGIPVVPFYDSKQDSELPLLSFYLLSISSYKDLREANKEHIKLEYFLTQNKNNISYDKETIKEEPEKEKDTYSNSFIENRNENNNLSQNSLLLSPSENNNNENNKNICNNIINKEKINKAGNKSEKKLFNILQVSKNFHERKKYNTVKMEPLKILDFFEKWKNAYLKLALKK